MKNVFGKDLKVCGLNPVTGYSRNGFCKLDDTDHGTHIVCAVVTKEFLDFTRRQGNDLITPSHNFPGLKPGNRWCLCIFRWIEAYKNGAAPFIDLNCTEQKVLQYVPYELLKRYSI